MQTTLKVLIIPPKNILIRSTPDRPIKYEYVSLLLMLNKYQGGSLTTTRST